MLSFCDPRPRCGRREFLKVGSLALGGLAQAALTLDQLQAAAAGRPVKDKSVVFLFMHGGPSQTETFDPKPDAPSNIRSQSGQVQTAIPGELFGGTLPRLAALADRLSIVRSYTTGDARHDIKPIVSSHSNESSLGSLYARVAGTNHPRTGMPTNAVLFPQAVDESTRPGTKQFGKFDATGSLGSAYAPFVPGAGGNLQADMKLNIESGRLDDRRSLLRQIDAARWAADVEGPLGGFDRMQEQAFNTILGGVAQAFDLSNERPETIARYDTAPLVRPDQISKKWNNYNNYVDNAKSLGKLMLLARRLCEAGCGFVTVTTNFVWDMHSDRNNAGVAEGMGYMGLPFDHAVSAFIEDIHQRGLQDDILLVCSGEIGRTPKVNSRGGRDHWGNLAPLLLSGGGLNMGQIVGQSTRDAGEPLSNPITINHLMATIMHTLLDIAELRLVPGIPGDVFRPIMNGTPIVELM